MNLEHSTPELFAALAKAQGEVENASKNAANPHFRSRYADLAEVLNTVRPVFAKHALTINQSTGFDGALVHVDTVIAHASGGYMTSRASCQPAKTDAQGVGSATTYLRRYALAAMAGVAQEDDDGQSAAHNGKPLAIDAAAQAKAEDFRAAIEAASSDAALNKVGKELADSELPAGLKASLRSAYSAKHKLFKSQEAA